MHLVQTGQLVVEPTNVWAMTCAALQAKSVSRLYSDDIISLRLQPGSIPSRSGPYIERQSLFGQQTMSLHKGSAAR